MVHEAEEHAGEDKRRREEIDARNELDTLAYRAEQLVGELGDRLPVHEKARAEQLVADARQAIEEQAGLDRVRPLDLRPAAGRPGASGRRRRGRPDRRQRRRQARRRPARRTRRSSMPNSHGSDGERAVEQRRGRRRRGSGACGGPRPSRSSRPATPSSTTATSGRSRTSTTTASAPDGTIERRVAEERERLARDWLDRGRQRRAGAADGGAGEPALPGTARRARADGGHPRAPGRDARRRAGRTVRSRAARGGGRAHRRRACPTARSSRSRVRATRLGDRVLRPAQVVVSQRGERES